MMPLTVADWLAFALIIVLCALGMVAFGIIETMIYFEWPIPCGSWPFDYLPCF